jgi:acyl carrier protein
MGLDSVEILVNVENAFGITISNYEAEKIYTVGDIHNIVWRNIQGRQSMRCKSQQLFYKLRYILINRYKVPRETIELDASLNNIFPQKNRRLKYHKLQKELQLKLPQLALPAAWARALVVTSVILIPGALAVTLVLIYGYHRTRWLYLLPALGLLATVFISNILDAVRTEFRPETVKDYTKEVLSLNYGTLMQDKHIDRKEMEGLINNIIAETIGIDLREISPEKSLAYDLGID